MLRRGYSQGGVFCLGGGVFPFRVVWRGVVVGERVLTTGGIIVFSKKFCARILQTNCFQKNSLVHKRDLNVCRKINWRIEFHLS